MKAWSDHLVHHLLVLVQGNQLQDQFAPSCFPLLVRFITFGKLLQSETARFLFCWEKSVALLSAAVVVLVYYFLLPYHIILNVINVHIWACWRLPFSLCGWMGGVGGWWVWGHLQNLFYGKANYSWGWGWVVVELGFWQYQFWEAVVLASHWTNSNFSLWPFFPVLFSQLSGCPHNNPSSPWKVINERGEESQEHFLWNTLNLAR